ncbi:MAG TPA: hypothetical protein VFD03_09275 [Clostridia bacterium]|nr:hypothetical protein [Clostridia bacterium]
MPPNDDKIRISARIPKDLYDSVLKIDDNFTRALIAALTALTEDKEKDSQTDNDKFKTNDDSELKARLDLTKGQLDIMTAQVEYLKGQIVIKDQQLDKQAFSLQSVIQENSRLNVKLLPENKEAKKPWWQFW